MKRKPCLIESLDDSNSFEKRLRAAFKSKAAENTSKMHKNTIWYKSLLSAEKSCLKQDKIKKIHHKFEDAKEMVEEYNVDTQVLLRRAWKVKTKLGGDGKWDVEIGDPIPDATPHVETAEILESNDQVSFKL